MKAKEILKVLKQDGWYEVYQNSSHMQLKHPTKPVKVTVPMHGSRDQTGYLESNPKAGRFEIAPC